MRQCTAPRPPKPLTCAPPTSASPHTPTRWSRTQWGRKPWGRKPWGRKPLRARCARHSAQRGAPRRTRRRRADRRGAWHTALGMRCTSLSSMTAVSILLMDEGVAESRRDHNIYEVRITYFFVYLGIRLFFWQTSSLGSYIHIYLFTGEAPAPGLLAHRDFLPKPRWRGFLSPLKRYVSSLPVHRPPL
jgi:hypothetical protein